MNERIQRLLSASCLWLLVLSQTAAIAQDGAVGDPSPALVTADVIEAKISEADGDPELQGEDKTKLVALYRAALSNLKQVTANRALAARFEETTRTAPAQVQLIRERIDSAKDADLAMGPDLGLKMPSLQLELRLEAARADLAAADARRADYERQLTYQENRPATISELLNTVRDEQDAIAASLKTGGGVDEVPAFAQARRWSLETKYMALSTEIDALDQEVISLPLRLALLEAKRDEEAAKVAELGKGVDALKALINAKLGAEAQQEKLIAQRMLKETAGLDPVLIRLAERNAALTDELGSISVKLDRLDEEQVQAGRLANRIEVELKREQAAVGVSGLDTGLGQLLLEHRHSLPNLKDYAQKADALVQQIAAVNLSLLRHFDEAERIADKEQAVAALAAELTSDDTPVVMDKLSALVEQRQSLLDKQRDAEQRYLTRLRKLQASEARMLEVARTYDDFLKEHLFWMRTEAQTRRADIEQLPEEVRRLLSPALWSELTGTLRGDLATSPAVWLSLLVSVTVLVRRRALVATIAATSEKVGRPAIDRFRYTLRALALSLLIAVPFPLLFGVAGWHLVAAAQGVGIPHAVGLALIRVAVTLFIILALRAICLPSGLAIAHFRWPESSARRLASALRWLALVFVPAVLVGRLAMDLNPVVSGGLVTRIALVVAALMLTLFLYRVLNPKRGVLGDLRLRPDAGWTMKAQLLWYPLVVAFPLVVLVAAFSGYVYSAVITASSYLFTLWLTVGLILLYALALRWLTLVRRRLAYRAAAERRQAAVAARESAASDDGDQDVAAALTDYADVDLDEVTEDSRELLRIVVVVIALTGLYFIWSAVLPALGILDEVTLWHRTATIGGEMQITPVSLADLGLALIYLIAMTVLAKRLPAVLDVILLERFHLTPGGRYTATTLTTYTIVTVGTLLALNTVGAQWSQVQWLVAALGVGIGFGLQEIVANFISGLIILFERPVRVGDMVTVGDTDGVVTKIRIRATTIRNLDRKELLVPNKEFITGRLLNWSLSDQVVRVRVDVGVAYGTDVDQAHALMREAAQEHQRVLDDPKPSLSFEGFGDNSLTLVLRAFIDDLEYRVATITDLHKAINRKFEQAGISISFPQRDVHLDTHEPLRVTIEPKSGG